jgi:hypothetical protein
MTAQQQQLTQPPSLPPHLEKVMLNSQTISDEDNSVLPVPNHVTLNHLYACSIKDGVMALAATSRYRKKVSINTMTILNMLIQITYQTTTFIISMLQPCIIDQL